MPVTYYVAPKIFTGEEWLSGHAVVVEAEEIVALIPENKVPAGAGVVRFEQGMLAPAFIDLQIYGANGKLLSVYPTVDALHDLFDYCAGGGATLFQPTVATNSKEVFFGAIDAVRSYRQQGGRGAIGLHVEGPWISMQKRGAHLPEYVHAPSMEEARELLEYGKGVISMITLAPEVCSSEVVRLVQSYGVVISAGHSNASFAEANHAFDELNISVATHLFNAMSALQHREPGLVGALFLHKSAMASIIPDGYHVDYAAIKVAKQMMGDRLFAITDAVTETTLGSYPHKLVGNKYESEGVLSGSALTMHKAFTNLVQHPAVPVDEALRMCSLYPAKVANLHHKHGKIAAGFTAHFVALNNDLSLQQTIC